MECTVSWTGPSGTRTGMGFVAETGSGHTLMMDGAPDAAKPGNGGQNLAPRPMETVLAGTGGCTAYDVVLILKRGAS
jgi:putative redox protein